MGLRGEDLVTSFFPPLINKRCQKHPSRCSLTQRYFHFLNTFFKNCPFVILITVLFFPGLAVSSDNEPLFNPDLSVPLDEAIWHGDLSSFRTDLSLDHILLRLNAPKDQSIASFATSDTYEPVYWEWLVRQNFNPSNNNRTFVFLNANKPDLKDNIEGLALRTGENGTPKHFKLLQIESGGSQTILLQSDVTIAPDTEYYMRVINTPQNDFHLYIGEGRDTTPLLQSESFRYDNEVEPGHFGFRTHFTATRSDQSFFGNILLDNNLPKPAVDQVSVTTSPQTSQYPHTDAQNITEMEVTFHLPPDLSSITTNSFHLGDDITPDAISCDHPQVCTLRFRDHIASGIHTLHFSPYKTIYDQTAEAEKHIIYIADNPEKGDIVINEFMYDPPANTPAYVELFNASEKLINLRDWRLQRRILSSENDRFITGEDRYLKPGEFLVLTKDKSALESRMNAFNVFEMNDFPRYNRSSPDKIRLFSSGQVLIDSLHYHPTGWGGFEVALERRYAPAPGWLETNWTESRDPQGGTPGYLNKAKPPVTNPSVAGFDHTSGDTLHIHLDRFIDPNTIRQPKAIQLLINERKKAAIQQITSDGNTVMVIPSHSLKSGTTYQLKISGLHDYFGNQMPEKSLEFDYYDTSHPTPKEVVINEFLYRPDQQSHHRFVELLNNSDNVFEINDWQISRSLGSPLLITNPNSSRPQYFMPGMKLVLSEPGLELTGPDYSEALHIESENFPSFSRYGDAIILRSPENTTIDSLYYTPEWGANRDGISLERINPDGATTDPSNWQEHPGGHSAGSRNHHFDPLPNPPKAVYAAVVNNNLIKLVFNRFIRTESLDNVSLSNHVVTLKSTGTPPSRNTSMNASLIEKAGNTELPVSEIAKNASIFYFETDNPLHRAYKELAIMGFMDVAGQIVTSQSVPLAFLPHKGDIVINEVMYQPIADRYSSKPDQSEYVELFNRTNLALQADGLYLHDQPDKNQVAQKRIPTGTDNTSLLPGEYAVIYPDTSSTLNESRLFNSFSLPIHDQKSFFQVNRMTLGLSTSGDAFYLSNDQGISIDSLFYTPSWHNPNIADVRGISLERISPENPSNQPANWTSSTHVEGGTPGYRNSVQPQNEPEINTGLTLTPNPFSPNGDGKHDHLFIHYELDEPDFLIQAKVFDRNGRLVRTLVEGERAGRKGKLIWDGRTDRGNMNRVGIYIIHIKLSNHAMGRSRVYRKTAVLARPL